MELESIVTLQEGVQRVPAGPAWKSDFLDRSRVHRDLPAGVAFDPWRLRVLSRGSSATSETPGSGSR